MLASNIIQNMRELKASQYFIKGSIKREIKSRYANTLLGPAWVILHPLMMILIYTLVFSKVMQSRLPETSGAFSYSIHLCAALLPWMFFSELLTRLQGMYVDNADLLKKLSFPKISLIAINMGVCVFNYLIFTAIFFTFLIATGHFPWQTILWILPPLFCQVVMTLCAGLFFAIANAHFRDTGHFTGLILQLGFWFTPIVYPFSVLPEWTHSIIQVNPMVGLSRFYQSIFLLEQPGHMIWLLPSIIFALVFFVLAVITHKYHGKEIADVL